MNKRESRQYITNFIVSSIGYIALGCLLLFAPNTFKHIICYLLGAVAIVMGIVRIAWYFKKDEVSRAFHNDIPYGVILLIVGVYLMARPDAVWDWLPVILGLAVVFDSMIKLQKAFDLKRTGFGHWWGVLAAALGTAVLGILLVLPIFSKNILLYYFGAVLIIDGLVNLATILLVVWRTRKQEKEASSKADASRPAISEAGDVREAEDTPGEAGGSDKKP